MTTMQQVSVQLTDLGTKTPGKGSISLPTLNDLSTPVQSVDRFAFLTGIPGADILRNTPGIEPYLHVALIPDLIFLAQQGRLSEAIGRADPKNPMSIVFNDPTQAIHSETQKVEMDILTGNIDVFESDVVCINPKCKATQVKVTYNRWTRSLDEPATMSARCMKCKRSWNQSMA